MTLSGLSAIVSLIVPSILLSNSEKFSSLLCISIYTLASILLFKPPRVRFALPIIAFSVSAVRKKYIFGWKSTHAPPVSTV